MRYARTIYYHLIMYTAGRIIRKGFSCLIDLISYLALLQFAKTVNQFLQGL